jgi:hypothetical protein
MADAEAAAAGTSSPASMSSPSASGTSAAEAAIGALKTKLGPVPPPSTRWGLGAAAGMGLLGAGSIASSEDAPAAARRGFLAGGGPSVSAGASSPAGAESAGRPIAIFFGFFALGGGRFRPPGNDEEALGGGSESEEPALAGAGAGADDLLGAEGTDAWMSSVSFSESLP